MRRKCERGRGNINADGAGAEVFVGDGCSQGASFGPMVAISRRGQGGRIYNNTRTRERLRRKCVKPADLTTHSPPKTVTRPRTATRPARAFSHSLPAHFRPPTQPRRTPAGCAMHSSPTSQHIPAEDLLPPLHSDTPCPSTSAPPRSPDTRPLTSQHIPRRRPSPAPAQRRALPEHFLTPFPHTSTPHAATMHAHRPHNPFPAEGRRPPPHSDAPGPSAFSLPPRPDAYPHAARCIPRRPHNTFPTEDRRPSPQRHAPPLLFRFGHKKTAPHSGCAMPNVSVDRRCGRSLGLVSRALFAAVAGRWRVGVGLRPQPWALRSRRCGRVLRA